jgi:hypothetical protein
MSSTHSPAPHPARPADVEREIRGVGFAIAARTAILPLLSSESLYVLDKPGGRHG